MPVRINARSKYRAVPIVVDGIRFASTKEARRYGELRLLERAGKIWDLTLQPQFELHAAGQRTLRKLSGAPDVEVWHEGGTPGGLVGIYRADFVYATKAGTIVEDAKGVRTALYQWKKKHVEIEYGVRIVEV